MNANNQKTYRPVKILGFALLGFSFIGVMFFVYTLFYDLNSYFYYKGKHSPSNGQLYFIAIVSAFNIITSVGIIYKFRWGYYLFKLLLYTMLPTLPMGIVSYKYLKYIKEKNIKSLFMQ